MRPIDPDYDPERDPEYEDALARYVSANPDSPDAGLARVVDAPSRPADVANIAVHPAAAPRPMGAPVAALDAMAPGASMPAPPKRPEDMSPEELDAAVQAKLGPKANWNPRPAPTPAGEAMFADLQAGARASVKPAPTEALPGDELPDQPSAGQVLSAQRAEAARQPPLPPTPEPPPTMLGAGLRGLGRVAPYVGNAIMRMGGINTGPILPDSTPAEPQPPPPSPAPPVSGAISGTLPLVSHVHGYLRAPASDRPLSARQGANIMATLRGPVANIVRDASGVPPVPSGDIPPGSPVGPASSVPPAALARAREVLGPAKERPDPLSLALAAARNNRLIAGSARAGAMAIGRGAGPGFDELDANADRPVQELGLREQAADKAKAEAAALGPLSPMEQTVYGKLLAQAGVNLDPATLAKLPAGKVRALIPDLEKMGAMEATRADKAAALKNAALQAEENRQNHLDVAKLAHSGAAGARADRLAEQHDNRIDREVERLGKDVEPLTKLKPDLTYLRTVASQKGDIAGTGVVASRAPDWMLSDEGVKTRQSLLRVASVYLSQQSGQNVTPSEAERFLNSRGMGAGATARSLRTGLAEMLPEFEAMAQSRISRHTTEAVGEYKARGGETDYSLGGAPTSGPRQIASDAEYDALPSGAEFLGPDGQHRRKP